ncbi:hypothetical protein M885DRAFT_531945 [Pelagophyceae sp. CCMP2097]|nr:hypothetical protein M885DRAFT_531945 [Pelagophyceae sp. CCMP2097]|mmetsp:Transcript_7150/g.25020  ORF Transcript_7150/g.25020 Transcript_7150/m.25020 type:complete len:1011 (-) Transcript_7150:41-3073(-)
MYAASGAAGEVTRQRASRASRDDLEDARQNALRGLPADEAPRRRLPPARQTVVVTAPRRSPPPSRALAAPIKPRPDAPPPEDGRVRLESTNAASVGLDGLEVTEADLAARGVDLRVSRAFESPQINLCAGSQGGEARWGPLKYGDVVVVVTDVDCEDSEHSEGDDDDFEDAPKRPLFRLRRERWGFIVGNAVTRGDGGQVFYSVLCQGRCSGDYSQECAAEKDAVERAAFAKADERKKRTGFYSAARQGFSAAPRHASRPPPAFTSNSAAYLLRARAADLERPMDRRHGLDSARIRALSAMVYSASSRSSYTLQRRAFDAFHVAGMRILAKTHDSAARIFQRAWNRVRLLKFNQAFTNAAFKAHKSKHDSLHSRFKYLQGADQAMGYTNDGKVYFATLAELNIWSALFRSAGQRIVDEMLKLARSKLEEAFDRWNNSTFALKELEAIGALHYTDEDRLNAPPRTRPDSRKMEDYWHPALGIALPPLPDLHSARNGAKRDVSDVVKFQLMRLNMRGPCDTSNWIIPGLLLMGAHPSGAVHWAQQAKGLAQVAKAAKAVVEEVDPSAASNALILAGCRTFVDLMPRSEARKLEAEQVGWAKLEVAGRALVDADVSGKAARSASPVQFGGCSDVLEPEEDESSEEGCAGGSRADLKGQGSTASTTFANGSASALLDGAACAAVCALERARGASTGMTAKLTAALILAEVETLAAKEERHDAEDPRFEKGEQDFAAAFGRQRRLMVQVANARKSLQKLPTACTTLRLPVADDSAFVDDAEAIRLCEAVEAAMRGGGCVYVYSRLGHGRAGMLCALLLGRLYGLEAHEALDRVQVYHDSRKCFDVRRGAVVSCPQSLAQRACVERLLARTDSIYSERQTKGRWSHSTRYAQPKRRNGVPANVAVTRAPTDARAVASSLMLQTVSERNYAPQLTLRGSAAAAARVLQRNPPAVIAAPTLRSLRPPTAALEAVAPPIAAKLLAASPWTAPRLEPRDIQATRALEAIRAERRPPRDDF